MKKRHVSIQASLLSILVLLTGLLFLLSVFIWLAFDRVAANQQRLITQSLPTLHAIDTVVDHGLDLLDISTQLSQVLTEEGFHRLESRVAIAFALIEQDLTSLSAVSLSQTDYQQLRTNATQLQKAIQRALNLQQAVVNNTISLAEAASAIVDAVEPALIKIKLIDAELAVNVADSEEDVIRQSQVDLLVELRFLLQRFEIVVDQLLLIKTHEAIAKTENQYRLLIQNLSRVLLEFEPKIRARLAPVLAVFNDNFIRQDNVFSLGRDKVELLRSLLLEQQKSLALNQTISTLYQAIALAANENLDDDAQAILGLIARSRVALVATVLVFIGIVLGVYLLFIRPKIIRRLLLLTQNTSDIAANKLAVVIPQDGNDEISAMAGALAYFRDQLIEKERVQMVLQDREKRLSTIIDNAAEALVTVNIFGIVLSVNPAAEKIFGASKDRLIGTAIAQYLPEARMEFTTHRRQSAEDEGSGLLVCADQPMSALRADGQSFSAKLSVNLINLLGAHTYSCFIRDVSVERQAQQKIEALVDELTRSNEDLERFAYSCSHDLQEPVRMVVSFGELLKHALGDDLDEKCRRYLDHIISNGESAKALINGILEYSRLDKSTVQKQWVSVDKLCQQVSGLLSGLIAERQASFTWENGGMKINVIDSQILQLLLNLVVNGLKYNDSRQPRVTVRAQACADYWIIAVSDNGIGIEPRYHSKIFEIFTRLVSRREYAGSGIGLSLCQKIVEKHGGTIHVESTPGEGSCFEVRLPIID
ncbi:MAG: PAS domain S-box protein [Cellvibrionaceae bacterium]|nr:PAS domain S-box protein [Cellvibrionaceae bacterium]